ncbi:MAG: ABC transporter permease subunit, partial [Devosiaceae bacterium]|nr:ABC transporter permease subunit [Devosiaceae bacterium]
VARVWRFPDALPQVWTLKSWSDQATNLWETGWRATIIGLGAATLSLALVLASLENEYRNNKRATRLAWWTIYIPLLVPQIALVGGLSVLFIRFSIDGTLWAVILVHMIFTYPYIYLTLSDPWNAFDTRYLAVARSLGKSVNRAFWSIRLPILLRPVLAAFALGFAVSIAQYLPTLLIGAGRQPTLTTEAIALASGGNRRVIGTYALVQTLLPLIVFALANLVPKLLWSNRRGLQVRSVE